MNLFINLFLYKYLSSLLIKPQLTRYIVLPTFQVYNWSKTRSLRLSLKCTQHKQKLYKI